MLSKTFMGLPLYYCLICVSLVACLLSKHYKSFALYYAVVKEQEHVINLDLEFRRDIKQEVCRKNSSKKNKFC